jgi:hypothetical protein
MENRYNIGELDTLVTLYAPTAGMGSEGEKKSTYSVHSQVYAKVDREITDQLAFDNYDGEDNAAITIYKVRGMNTRWQVGISDKLYEILSIDTVSRVSPVCVVSIKSFD